MSAVYTGQSSGSAIGLNLQTLLYVGGVDQSSIRVSPDVAVERGFTGCISQVTYLLHGHLLFHRRRHRRAPLIS